MGKDNLTKSKNKSSDDSLRERFEKIWALYPKKKNKEGAWKHYKTWIKASAKHTDEYLLHRLELYKQDIKVNHIKPQFIMYGSTWFGGRFEDTYIADRQDQKNGGFDEKMLASSLTQEQVAADDELPF